MNLCLKNVIGRWFRVCSLVLVLALQAEVQGQRRARTSLGVQLWSRLDPQGTGHVSMNDALQVSKAWFERMDYGRSGILSQDEFLSRFEEALLTERRSRRGRSSASLNRFLGLFLVLDADRNRSLGRSEMASVFGAILKAGTTEEGESVTKAAFLKALDQRMPLTNLSGMENAVDEEPDRLLPKVPPSPVLSPSLSLKTLVPASGFSIELSAAEPLIEDPIAFAFDPHGRLFVVELRSFMMDIDGSNERAPISRISLLEDLDHDGVFDTSSRFLEGLILPRSVLPIAGGILYVADYQLFFAKDTDGDGKADVNHLIDAEFGRGNVEHAPNGLMLGLDNWIYNAKSRTRYRLLGNQWLRQETEFRGQWGLTKDNRGRLFYNINNSQLLGDFSPPNYMGRNSNHPSQAGLNLYVATDQRVFPLRMNTAVNRGYLPDVLDEKGRLHVFASSCSPVIYRGDAYGLDFVGNAFVCDPAANLVKRNLVIDQAMGISSRFAYPDHEFLASTDERFRPVGLANGPDGNLWLLDMYRGISQYGMFMTKYLRNETLKRDLEKGIHLGRIYRIVRGGRGTARNWQLPHKSSDALIDYLGHPNGWVRDTAQALLIERRDAGSLSLLIDYALSSTSRYGRVHALWAMEGLVMDLFVEGRSVVEGVGANEVPRLWKLNKRASGLRSNSRPESQRAFETCLGLIDDRSMAVQTVAIRVAESLSRGNPARQEALLEKLESMSDQLSLDGMFQAILSAGELPQPRGFSVFQAILKRGAEERLIREGAISGLGGWELAFLQALLTDPEWRLPSPGKRAMLHALSAAVVAEGDPIKCQLLFGHLNDEANQGRWAFESLSSGLSQGVRVRDGRRIPFSGKPAEYNELVRSENSSLRELATKLDSVISWPGHHWDPNPPDRHGDTPADSGGEGRELFVSICAGCHGTNGEGVRPMAPPLKRSEWVENPARLVQIILHGMQGPVEVAGKSYKTPNILPEMPPLSILGDSQIAAIGSYLRPGKPPIVDDLVARERQKSRDRDVPWFASELLEQD